MPQSLVIGLLVLGGVLLLVAITGGKFKIFGAEIDGPVSSKTIRLLSGVLGTVFVLLCLGKSGLDSANQGQTASGKQTPAFDSGTPTRSKVLPASSQGGSGTTDGRNSADKQGVSSAEYAIVFNPPSNVRVLPSKNSDTLCSVTAQKAIRILGSDGNFYKTDVCGSQIGYIHRSQVKF